MVRLEQSSRWNSLNPERMDKMKLFGTMAANEQNHLTIGGVDTVALAKKHGTPLYVMDQGLIEENIETFLTRFQSEKFDTDIVYASKAFVNLAFCKLIADKGLSMDTLSDGDLYIAKRAKFPMERIVMHGNSKSIAELTMALDLGVGVIVVDNHDEFLKLDRLTRERKQMMRVLVRVNPGIEAHTHEYIQTATYSSKFGESIFDPNIFDWLAEMNGAPYLQVEGIHCHIGSQIFESTSFLQAVRVMTEFVAKVETETAIRLTTLNLGGGFGVYYTEGDAPIALGNMLDAMIATLEEEITARNLGLNRVMIEPGRSIVCNAGTTLYSVESRKTTYSGKSYVLVDGGMTDNPRPALYQAVYEGVLANRMGDEPTESVCVAGKCCESGDVLIQSTMLQPAEVGDVLAIASTGAYTYSMSSNYNSVRRAAVVMVKDGQDRLVTKRESFEDLVRNDLDLEA